MVDSSGFVGDETGESMGLFKPFPDSLTFFISESRMVLTFSIEGLSSSHVLFTSWQILCCSTLLISLSTLTLSSPDTLVPKSVLWLSEKSQPCGSGRGCFLKTHRYGLVLLSFELSDWVNCSEEWEILFKPVSTCFLGDIIFSTLFFPSSLMTASKWESIKSCFFLIIFSLSLFRFNFNHSS